MLYRWFLILGLIACAGALTITRTLASAATEGPQQYALGEIITLALEHHPAIAGAQGVVQQSRGQQVAAGAYLNPSVSGAAGRGSIRDPSTGVSITERTVTVEQPLEWQGKRRARQQAADASAAGAGAAMDETRLNVVADVKVAFYYVLFAQRDAELTSQNLTMVEEVLRTEIGRAHV